MNNSIMLPCVRCGKQLEVDELNDGLCERCELREIKERKIIKTMKEKGDTNDKRNPPKTPRDAQR